jgi:hypothetical protein
MNARWHLGSTVYHIHDQDKRPGTVLCISYWLNLKSPMYTVSWGTDGQMDHYESELTDQYKLKLDE